MLQELPVACHAEVLLPSYHCPALPKYSKHFENSTVLNTVMIFLAFQTWLLKFP